MSNTENKLEDGNGSDASTYSALDYNINHKVSVQLTQKGMFHYVEYHKKYGVDVEMPKADKEGWWTTQMHELMSIYGSKIGLGLPLMFNSNIRIHTDS